MRPAAPAFLPIALPAPVSVELPTVGRGQSERGKTPPREPAHADASRIEIELANGRRVRVGACVDFTVLKKIIDLLEA